MTGGRDVRAAEHRARFEQSAMPQVTCDLDGRIVDVNEALCRLLDRPAAAVVGRPVSVLNHATDGGAADAALRELLSQRTDSAGTERVLRGAGGRPVPVLDDSSLLRDRSGQPLGTASFLQDLARLRDAERSRQQQDDFFLALCQRASDLAIVADADGHVVFVSPAVQAMFGYDAVEQLGRSGWEFVHPEDAPQVQREFATLLQAGGARTARLRVQAADGSWLHIEQTMTDMLHTPVGGIVCNLRDVTAEVRVQQALTASEARYRAIVENADEGIWVAGRDGSTTFVNARMLAITGLSAETVYASRPIDLLESAVAKELVQRLISRAAQGTERHEIDYHHPDGSIRHLSLSVTPLTDDTGFEGSLALVSDVTGTRSATRRLEHAATHDALTDLPNRARLQQVAAAALLRSPDSTAVLFIDLDNFKVINDARGHGAGDDVLREVARRLQTAARPGDLVARFGGDEFVVVAEGVDAAAARAVADRLLDAIEEAPRGGECPLPATASVGIALSPAPSAEQLLRHADAAMYAAKAAGRRSIRFFDDSLADKAEDRYRISRDLRSAIRTGQLRLAYQPVVCLRTGTVVGAEGLARWPHPKLGDVPPDRFVPVALETGLAAELDFWGIRSAARDLAAFRAAGAIAGDAYVAVNLSARTLDDPHLFAELGRAVDDHGLRPQDLVLEVTEAAVVTRGGEGVATLQALSRAGHLVAIDDFGTGHSALAYLQDLPAAILKIDRSFVRDLVTSRPARAIVGSVIGLAHGLQMCVVAEGVEEAAQADVLRDMGCDAGQGWLWSAAGRRSEVLTQGSLSRTY